MDIEAKERILNNAVMNPAGPIVIGGMGGSGTRCIAQILLHLGCYLGSDLNTSYDNLAFTLLFKRPRWLQRNRQHEKKLHTGLRILENTYSGKGIRNARELAYLAAATIDMSLHGHDPEGHGRGSWAWSRMSRIVFSPGADCTFWGWKEPNSHLILPAIASFFPALKYIHVVRHGLDMAYSKNQTQLYNWGSLFGVPAPKSTDELPFSSFRYWVEMNRKVLADGATLGEKHFFLLNFDQLCRCPEDLSKLIQFLGIEVPEDRFKEAASIPQTPKSTGRYDKSTINAHRPDDINFLTSLGFEL